MKSTWFLAVAAALLALAVGASAQTWNPTEFGLGDLDFIGPECYAPNDFAPPAGTFDDVRGAEALHPTSANYLASGSVTRYRFENTPPWDGSDAAALEGYTDGTDDFVHLHHATGFFIGSFDATAKAGAGDDVLIQNFGTSSRTQGWFCLYGATAVGGPYHFIGGQHFEAFDDPGGPTIAFDLDRHYTGIAGTTDLRHIAYIGWAGNNPLTADFTWSPDNPIALDPVAFLDASWQTSDNMDRWEWDFGDGATSALQHPTHAYDAPGTYDVCLTAYDDDRYNPFQENHPTYGPYEDTICKDITVDPRPPVADFTWTIDEDAPYRSVDLHDQSFDLDGTLTAWSWSYPGGTSSVQEPRIRLPSFNTNHSVTLTVTDDVGLTHVVTKPIRIDNEVPLIDEAPELVQVAGGEVSWQARGLDPDGHVTHFEVHGLPPGAEFTEAGAFTWRSSENQVGVYDIVVKHIETHWRPHVAATVLRVQLDPPYRSPSSGDADGDGVPDESDPDPACAECQATNGAPEPEEDTCEAMRPWPDNVTGAWIDGEAVLSWNSTACEGRFLVWNGTTLATVLPVTQETYQAIFDTSGTWLVQGATKEEQLGRVDERGVVVTVEAPVPKDAEEPKEQDADLEPVIDSGGGRPEDAAGHAIPASLPVLVIMIGLLARRRS